MLDLIAQWLWVVPFGASFVSRPQTCHCHCVAGEGPSQGVLELLGQQLARCGPEHLRQSCPECPQCSCPAPPEVVSPLGWAFFVGVCTGALVAFLVARLAASLQEVVVASSPLVVPQQPPAAELQDRPVPATPPQVVGAHVVTSGPLTASERAAGPLTASERRRQTDGGASISHA